jgi:hypothetical protein
MAADHYKMECSLTNEPCLVEKSRLQRQKRRRNSTSGLMSAMKLRKVWLGIARQAHGGAGVGVARKFITIFNLRHLRIA